MIARKMAGLVARQWFSVLPAAELTSEPTFVFLVRKRVHSGTPRPTARYRDGRLSDEREGSDAAR